jgi:hypothetical protein
MRVSGRPKEEGKRRKTRTEIESFLRNGMSLERAGIGYRWMNHLESSRTELVGLDRKIDGGCVRSTSLPMYGNARASERAKCEMSWGFNWRGLILRGV